MPSANLARILEEVKALSPEERQELRRALESEPETPPILEVAGLRSKRELLDELDRRLLAAGLIRRIPPPITDFTPYQNRKPVEVEGEPLSETIIKERRSGSWSLEPRRGGSE